MVETGKEFQHLAEALLLIEDTPSLPKN